MALRLNSWYRNRRAERQRDDCDQFGTTVREPVDDDSQHRDGGQRRGEAQEDECTAGSTHETRVRDLPENLRWQSPIRGEDGASGEAVEDPDAVHVA